MSRGADENAKGRWEQAPIHLASRCGPEPSELVEFLLLRGADVNARDAHGDTPLHNAADGCHLKTVELLLQHGADVHAKNSNGAIPLRGTDDCQGDEDYNQEDLKAVVKLLRYYGGMQRRK